MQAEGFTVKMTGGGMMDDVDHISVGFNSNIVATIDEARTLYVHGVERLLARINNDLTIRPYLHNYPFAIDNLYHMNFQRLPVDASGAGPIVFVFCGRGHVVFTVNDPAHKDTNPLQTAHSEPYTEALRIVREAGQLPEDLVSP